MSITRGRPSNQSENTFCCTFWQKLKFYACQLLLTLKKKTFLQVTRPYYKTVQVKYETVEFCLVHDFTLSKILTCFSVDFILKTRWLTGIDFWIKVIFCRSSVKFPTVPGHCVVLELMIIIRKLHFLHKIGHSRRWVGYCLHMCNIAVIFMMIKLSFGMFAIYWYST